MLHREEIYSHIKNVNKENFDVLALELFQYQAQKNPVYKTWIDNLGVKPEEVKMTSDIPFLPISAFKNHRILSKNQQPVQVFRSSGTTGQVRSTHYVADPALYHYSCRKNFEYYFGKPEDKVWLGLLPSYLERDDASLIDMVKYFMDISAYPEDCGFYLNQYAEIQRKLEELEGKEVEVFLIGVSFALLNWVETTTYNLPTNVKIIETGGMKGMREEVTRDEMHSVLKESFQVDAIYSEYGMTELFSQAYTDGGNVFRPGPSMKILGRGITDPLEILSTGEQVALNIIDLHNIDSCSFIGTEDLGKINEDGTFEVLGRMDNSDMRGCNLIMHG